MATRRPEEQSIIKGLQTSTPLIIWTVNLRLSNQVEASVFLVPLTNSVQHSAHQTAKDTQFQEEWRIENTKQIQVNKLPKGPTELISVGYFHVPSP